MQPPMEQSDSEMVVGDTLDPPPNYDQILSGPDNPSVPPPASGPLDLPENEFPSTSEDPPSMTLARYEYVMSSGKTVELPAIKFRDQDGKQYVIAPTHPAIDREARTAAPEHLTNKDLGGRLVSFVRSAINKAFPTRRVFSRRTDSAYDIQPQVLPLQDFESQTPLANARSRSNHKTFNDIELLPAWIEELTRFNVHDRGSSARMKAEMLRQSALRNLTPEERQSPERIQAAANSFFRKFLDDLSVSLRNTVFVDHEGELYCYTDNDRIEAASSVDWMRQTLAMQDPSEGPGGVQLTLMSSRIGIFAGTFGKSCVMTTNLDAIGNPIDGTTVRHRMEKSMLTTTESAVSSSYQPSRIWKPTSVIEPLRLRSVNHSDVDVAFKNTAGTVFNFDDKTYSVLTNVHALDLLKAEIWNKHHMAQKQLNLYEASLGDPTRDPTQYINGDRVDALRGLIVASAEDLVKLEKALETLTTHYQFSFDSNLSTYETLLESARRHDPLPSYPDHVGVTSSIVPLNATGPVHVNEQRRQEKSPTASEHSNLVRPNFA